MRRILAIGCVLALGAFARAGARSDTASANSLSPEEIAEGWVLLFDGETTFGWKVEGEARVENGELVLGGTKETIARPTADFGECQLIISRNSGASIDFAGSRPQVPDAKAGPVKLARHAGSEAFALHVKAGDVARVAGVKVKPLETRPLFNGKDLTGWKQYTGEAKRTRSQFSVTKEGWLSLKDGPGDLQTEAQFADFVLQLECRSNGPHLNSGVFFRCIPGLYQQGYEAQIRNEFTPAATQEYTVEVYDPQSHELKGKHKVKSTAVDYGTGAIYRRVPARKELSNDGAWFTMTVVANGRHLATWVNGVQQADWTDNRPLKDNARNGCRLEKGAISLQGHDRTTDLTFRNIRIAELPAGK